MKTRLAHLFFFTILAGLLVFSTGCASTRTENGVSIEKQRSLNPLYYIPDIPGI